AMATRRDSSASIRPRSTPISRDANSIAPCSPICRRRRTRAASAVNFTPSSRAGPVLASQLATQPASECCASSASCTVTSSSIDSGIFGTHDEKTLIQLRGVATRAAQVALMADGHTGYVMPIGGVAAYRNKVSVVGVGFDIACGNAAIMTDRVIGDFTRDDLERIATEIQRTISFGIGLTNRSADAPNADTIVEDPAWNAIPANAQSDLK